MRQVSSSRAGKQVQSQRALDHLSSFLFFCPHENLSKQAKLIEIKVIFRRVGLSGCLITKWPPSRSLQQCVNGGHRSETMLFDPTSQEISNNKAFSGLYLFLPWGQEEQKAPLCSNSEAFRFSEAPLCSNSAAFLFGEAARLFQQRSLVRSNTSPSRSAILPPSTAGSPRP